MFRFFNGTQNSRGRQINSCAPDELLDTCRREKPTGAEPDAERPAPTGCRKAREVPRNSSGAYMGKTRATKALSANNALMIA
jgi:hypothetical protein